MTGLRKLPTDERDVLELAQQVWLLQRYRDRPYASRLKFSIQTNGTLVDANWAEYFRENRFSVGVSLDGPEWINDQTRVNANGLGSFNRAMRGIKNLHAAGLGVGVICVVTKENQNSLVQLLEICRDNDIYQISFLPYFPSGYGKGKELQLKADNLEYWEQTKQVISWLVDHNTNNPDHQIYEREIASIVKNIILPGNGCYMCASSPCGAGTQHVGLDVNGDVFVCDTFYGMDEYIIGNVERQSLDEVLANPLVDKFRNRTTKTVPNCSRCSLNDLCYGGCPAHNVLFYGEEGFNRESHMCQWFKKIIPYLKQQFDEDKIDPRLLSDLPRGVPVIQPSALTSVAN